MSDLQQQLQALRERVAQVNRKFAARENAAHKPFAPSRNVPVYEDEHASFDRSFFDRSFFDRGSEVNTDFGCHFESETVYPGHRRHGSADIGALSDLPADLLAVLSDGAAPPAPPEEWAFLDTETTGIAGGSGTCAFLVGVGQITPTGFRVRQFFMRDYAEEASVLSALSEHLARFRVLITYNGRTFDQPLLETRYRLNRSRPPFARLGHLDLLYGARRLWKLRYESCRLVDLEQQVLGFEREGDVPGALIPYLYFEYLRTRRAARLLPVFHHNVLDIVTLACLTAIVPSAFHDDAPLGGRHGCELLGLARWRRQTGDLEQCGLLLRQAIDAGLPDDLLFRTLWDLAQVERKLGQDASALTLWTDLAECRNPFRVQALEELAKHHEHRTKDPIRALDYTRAALEFEDSPALRHRERRLTERLARGKWPSGKLRSTAPVDPLL